MTEAEQKAARQIVLAAFENQDILNKKLAEDWQEKGWPFFRAIWREAAEGFDHINWEWWKHAEPGSALSKAARQQIAIELADIFHFGLSSDIVQYKGKLGEVTDYYVRCFELAQAERKDLEEHLELLIVDSILCKSFNVKKFAHACKAIGLSLGGLMGYYFGKTALNEFRWANGYKEKTYKKMWKLPGIDTAVEDNVVLADVIDNQLASCKDIESFWYSIKLGHFIRNVNDSMQALYGTIEN